MEERGEQGERSLSESFWLVLCACWVFSRPKATDFSLAILHSVFLLREKLLNISRVGAGAQTPTVSWPASAHAVRAGGML